MPRGVADFSLKKIKIISWYRTDTDLVLCW